MSDVSEWLRELAHQPWFIWFDLAFHLVVVGHVVAHACRALGRLHRLVSRIVRHNHGSHR